MMESDVHPSVHSNYRHQIVFAKFNFKMCYPPLFECEICHYENANAVLIRRSFNQFTWDNRFSNLDVNRKVHLFKRTVKNILTLYRIPHETVICDDRDPPWINSKIKGLI